MAQARPWLRPILVCLALGTYSCGPPTEAVSPEGSACVPSEKRLTPDYIAGSLRSNIAQIRSDKSFGSGFFLSTNDPNDVLIVTNYHVIAEGSTFSVRLTRSDGKAVNVSDVEVVKTIPKDDLALLKAPRMTAHGAGLSLAKTTHNGESATTLGYPAIADTEGEPTLGNGFVTATKHTIDDRSFVLTDIALLPGNSGGPAVDSCGQVIGVTTAFLTEARSVGLLVPVAQIQKMYDEYVAPRPPDEEQIKERLEKFGRLLERGDEETASAYFSRSFYDSIVFPLLNRAAKEYVRKNALLTEALRFLREQGYDTSRLTRAQLAAVTDRIGVEITPMDLFIFKLLNAAREQNWDTYVLLRKFFQPYLNDQFGRVDEFHVEDVATEGKVRPVYATIKDVNGRSQTLRIDMVHEWGDWQISGFQQVRGARATYDEAPRRDAQITADVPSDSNMIPVTQKR